MSDNNGAGVLSELDFLKLTDEKRVARVDLSRAGRHGVIFVVELSADKQQEIFFSKNRKRKITKDGGQELELPADSGARLMEECVVTDDQGGAWLESLFREEEEMHGAMPEYVLVPTDRLVYMREAWVKEAETPYKMRERLKTMPNAVTSLIAGAVNRISGMGDEDEVEEKKDS